MWRKLLSSFSILLFAFGILFTSIFRTASVKYNFTGASDLSGSRVLGEETSIDYNLAYPGNVLPDSSLWPVKALRDKVWLSVTTNSSRKAELLLLFADKRMASAKLLFERGEAEDGFTALTKAEKYLDLASTQELKSRGEGNETNEFLRNIALASLKHYETMNEVKKYAPEDAIPQIIASQKTAIGVYGKSRDALLEKGIDPPEVPFEW